MRALAHDVSDGERRSALGALHVTQPRGRERAAIGAAAARADVRAIGAGRRGNASGRFATTLCRGRPSPRPCSSRPRRRLRLRGRRSRCAIARARDRGRGGGSDAGGCDSR
ncbi:hypothetical protein C1W84_30920 [Burkholderia pseudomallei]|nr:hypothetical protein [Burkholderia pseudomallei]NAX78086.1 hypothetical protein [Burkholderia pseudomallei]NAY19082.1 hypothetical protein [Burkholderia pseudomallei]NAY25557.1 hypothetical protein [Burkholderia pseudomallei]NAY32158.1 hypothetical protein [Burkholderia pseudomallei]